MSSSAQLFCCTPKPRPPVDSKQSTDQLLVPVSRRLLMKLRLYDAKKYVKYDLMMVFLLRHSDQYNRFCEHRMSCLSISKMLNPVSFTGNYCIDVIL